MALLTSQRLADLPIMRQFYEIFSKLFKIKVVLRSPNGAIRVPLGDPPSRIPFCSALRKHEIGNFLCEKCDRDHVRQVKTESRSLKYHCHVGMTEFIVPILLENEIIAVLIAGQIMDNKPSKESWLKVQAELTENGLDAQDFKNLEDLYYKTPIISPSIQKDLLTQLELFGNYVANVQDQILQGELAYSSLIVLRAQSFIKDAFVNPISLGTVAKAANASIRNLSRQFISETGMTVLDFIHNIRISHAQRQLKNTDKSCLEIAFESGFGSIQQFNRVFKKISRTTPSDWRQIQNKSK